MNLEAGVISTHILDTSRGVPAIGVRVSLQKQEGSTWRDIGSGITNADGRFVFDCEKVPGVYRLNFGIEEYFKKDSIEFFFMDSVVCFKVENTNRKYHVPLLLNPYGYSTYRGT